MVVRPLPTICQAAFVKKFHLQYIGISICSLPKSHIDAVEQNSRGKSGSDWMCLFHNNGGHHRTSGDAPLETHDVGERAGIHSILTNDFVCYKDGQKRTELCC